MIILSPQLGISPTATTGGETYDREVLKQFASMGEEIKILLPKGKLFPSEFKKIYIDRTSIGHFVPPDTFSFFALPWVIQRIKEEERRKRVVLRIHSPEYLFWTAYMVKKLYPEVSVVAHYHLDQTGRLWTMMNRKLLNMMDAVIADSEYLKRRLINRVGVREDLIHVIHCGVDTAAIRPRMQNSKCKIQNCRIKTIMFLGRFIERKRPDFAVEVFSRLHQKYPYTRLVMVGEGPMENKLKMQSAKLKIADAIEFTGPLFGVEKLKKYHEADLFLFPSEKEGFVLVVLEAMAAGLPLLVPAAMGFAEAVDDGGNGFLAEPGDVNDWTRKAEKILFNDKLSIEMRKRSRKMAVGKFSWEKCAEENLRIYRQVVQ